jgi:hypothetical protein
MQGIYRFLKSTLIGMAPLLADRVHTSPLRASAGPPLLPGPSFNSRARCDWRARVGIPLALTRASRATAGLGQPQPVQHRTPRRGVGLQALLEEGHGLLVAAGPVRQGPSLGQRPELFRALLGLRPGLRGRQQASPLQPAPSPSRQG